MTNTLLKFTVLSAACTMLTVSTRAQAESQNNDQSTRSWSAKRLSATGRMNEPIVSGSKIMGAQVNDSSGKDVGRIQDTIVNARSGRIDFALISLNAGGEAGTAASSSGNLIPVPWSLLRTSAASQYAASSPQPVFTLSVDQNKLRNAPTVGQSDLNESEWRQRVYAYYGVTPQPAMGGGESDQGEMKGEGARQLLQGNQEAPQPPATK